MDSLEQANEALRSVYQVIQRRGDNTHWEALEKLVLEVLVVQSQVINGTSNVDAATCTARTYKDIVTVNGIEYLASTGMKKETAPDRFQDGLSIALAIRKDGVVMQSKKLLSPEVLCQSEDFQQIINSTFQTMLENILGEDNA